MYMTQIDISWKTKSEGEGLAGHEWLHISGEEENEVAHVPKGETGRDSG